MIDLAESHYFRRVHLRFTCVLLLLIATSIACALKTERREVPSDVEAAIASISEDLDAERYEKIYNESSDLWKQDASLEQSTNVFRTLRSKLGKVKNRVMHSATEQENSGGPLQGRAFIVAYQTNFERGEGMETFTLVERDHKWQLAGYRVNSTALQ